WDFVNMKKYFAIDTPHGAMPRRRPVAPVLTSRGCPARCVFCASHRVHGRTFRGHSPERVLKEISHLVGRYGAREIQFEDDNLTYDRERALGIFRGIQHAGLDITWTAPNGLAVWRLDEELMVEMKRSGCYLVNLAIESGVGRVLKEVIHKPLNLEKVRQIVATLRRLDIGVSGFFVVGFPGETREEIKQTFRYVEELKLDNVNYSIAIPLPGTELYRICEKKGLLSRDVGFARYRSRIAATVSDQWTPKELERMVSWASLRFRVRLLLRDPVEFFSGTVMRFVLKPRYFLAYTKLLFDRSLRW
ncbi:MAG: radical SAM protein, partial [Candidatus Eisenbacteria bacterium]